MADLTSNPVGVLPPLRAKSPVPKTLYFNEHRLSLDSCGDNDNLPPIGTLAFRTPNRIDVTNTMYGPVFRTSHVVSDDGGDNNSSAGNDRPVSPSESDTDSCTSSDTAETSFSQLVDNLYVIQDIFISLTHQYVPLCLIDHRDDTTVYQCMDVATGHTVCLKIVSDPTESCDGSVKFNDPREVRALAHLKNVPHVQRISAFYRFADGYAIVSDFYSDTLKYMVADDIDKSKRVKTAIDVMSMLMDALSNIHKAGVAHMDIKTSNVMFDSRDNKLVLIDFGCAVPLGSQVKLSLTGTSGYTAPEIESFMDNPSGHKRMQFKPCMDVYSAGVVLYQILYGVSECEVTRRDIRRARKRVKYVDSTQEDVPNTGASYNRLQKLFKDMTNGDPDKRPTVSDIAAKLQKLKN